MLSIQGAATPQSKEICSLPMIRVVPRARHACKDASCVARPMPVEVVAKIFDFVARSSHDPIAQSTSLSHVCRQWRQISLSMPSLWSLIQLSFPLSKNQLARTCTWIIRSRNRPLDVYMDFRDPDWDWDESSHNFGYRAMDGVMCLLVPHASRWRSIELLTDTWAPIFAFLSCTAAIESVPCLQTIRLARCNEYFVAPGEVFRPANLASPVAWFGGGTGLRHLRQVSLSGVHIDWAQSGLAGLRGLELRYHAQDVMPTLPEFRRILRANATLERLVILGWGPQMDPASKNERGSDDDLPVIELPLLEEFECGFVDVVYTARLMSLFALPGLRALSIEDVAFGIQSCERLDCSQLLDCLVRTSASSNLDAGVPHIPLGSVCELSLRRVGTVDGASISELFGRLCALTTLHLECIDGATLLAICSALGACDQLRGVTLKDVDAAVTALVVSSGAFPSHLCVVLDIDEDVDVDEKDSAGEDEFDCRVFL